MRRREDKKVQIGLVLLLALQACVPLSAAEPNEADVTKAKPVLCWYMVCYHNGVEDYMEEMALAQAHGIDGFFLDISGAAYQHAADKETNYGKALTRMFEAAKRLGTGFKLVLTPEVYVARGNLDLNVKEMLRRFHQHPNTFHYQGRPVFATYIGRPGMWAKPLAALKEEAGIDPLWIGKFDNKRWSFTYSPRIVERIFGESEDLDGLVQFGVGPTAVEVNSNTKLCRTAKKLDKICVAGVNPNYNSANCIDRRGLEGYETLWRGAINDGADMVGIVIWNDYNEDSNLFPGRWPLGAEKEYISRDESYLNATAHYAAWYKTGVQPDITQDKFFTVYRTRTKWQDRAWDVEKKEWVRIRNREYPYDQFHDDHEANLYVSTFLTAPAEMTVTLGEQVVSKTVPAGTHTLAVPLSAGTPHLTLRRDGTVLAAVVGGKQVIAEETKENSSVHSKSKHLLYRNYTYGTAVGPVVKTLVASKAKRRGDAAAAEVGGAAGVQTQPTEGSGLEWPLSGLTTATYNLRITYSNPDDNDARLTMNIDGLRTKGADEPGKLRNRMLPVSFAPTGEGTLATTSLLWSLFDNTTLLRLEYQLGERFGRPYPAGDDKGSVFIEKVELVRVEPTVKPDGRDFTVPQMVKIPGGRFSMGSDTGTPDEKPVRTVTLSPFAISKYEVTNEQFEQFMADHNQYRDEYSWRDRDPVIYVKWLEAMEYCNWLSEKQGLKPAYVQETYRKLNKPRWNQLQNQYKRQIARLKKAGRSTEGVTAPEQPLEEKKRWVLDPTANGYRLPTEAQWEYVAAGRDQNRTYVWGNTEPDKDSCHAARARGEKPNEMPVRVPAAGFLPGVMPVGSFPNDRTRDGVMDMAGNVSEWCTDWYDVYDPKDVKDPRQSNQSKPKYRAIRGGSWGYYNYSLRVADREYNTQVYPGYCYIGFRVALPENGWNALQK